MDFATSGWGSYLWLLLLCRSNKTLARTTILEEVCMTPALLAFHLQGVLYAGKH